jgi:hypothetical protein
VAGHRYVAGPGLVVPLDGETEKFVAFPVGGDFVEFFEDVDEMLSVFATGVFYSEVINN